ncbi:MAG: DNA repair protein RecO [Planctomycetia bacterium]|nr:DNA repair protein RecO [Planctomycetia bacterium]
MAAVTSDAIVLRTTDFSESSLIVTLFTRKYGKIEGIAKGARRLKNPFESALDLLTQISVSFIMKDNGTLDLLTESKLRKRFRPRANNLPGLYAGYYVAELTNLMTEPGLPIPELYDEAAETLNRLEVGGGINHRLLRFEWRLLELSGRQPSLRHCVECGCELDLSDLVRGKERVSFALNDGGALCPECRRQGEFHDVASVTASTLSFLDSLACEHEGQEAAEPAKRTLGEARGLMNRYLCDLLGRRPRMHNYMRLITSA